MPKALTVHPSELRPNPWNSNYVSPDHELKLEESLRRFGGLFKPIVVRQVKGKKGYEILGGEHRWEAAKKAGHAEIPIFNLEFIDDKTAKEISLADNARYGADDSAMLAEIFKSIGDRDDIQAFLPFSGDDLNAVFTSADIALDDLDLPEEFDATDRKDDEPPAARAPKTHTIMRFKVPINDAEKITSLIEKTKHRQGYIASDDMTNAGDALVHLLLTTGDDE